MISWHEGTVVSTSDSDRARGLLNVSLADQPLVLQAQVPIVKGNQSFALIKENSQILVYRTTSTKAKVAQLLGDGTSLSDFLPTNLNTTISSAFKPGEISLQAFGDSTGIPTLGGLLHLTNFGDAVLSSGALTSSVEVNDTTNSIELTSNNINLQLAGNIAFTHAVNLNTLPTGATELRIGTVTSTVRTPISGLHITPTGSINIGQDLEIAGISTLTNGLSWDIVSGVQILSPRFTAISALISFTGNTSFVGPTSIVGTTSITGTTALTGSLNITPLSPPFTVFNYTGIISPAPAGLAALGASGMIPITVNGAAKFILIV